ncbi:MAG: hypothetical protein JWP96_2844, partial [Polaromonas sp.]|nr:hypothetical protein [Polaromonas sp.]
MNVALAGLTAREEVALGMLVGKSLAGWECTGAPAGLDAPLPPAELYVVDLAGRGLARWSEAAQGDLLKVLQGAPAVLVAPAFDQSWAALDADLMKSQPLVLLRKPYGTQDMLAALKQAAPVVKKRPPVTSPAIFPIAPPPPPKARMLAALAPGAIAAPVIVAKTFVPMPAVVVEEQGEMTLSEFQARLDAFPSSGAHVFLHKLAQALALRHPFEVRLSTVNRLIFNPDAQWVASNIAKSALERLCHDEAFASALEIDEVDA